MPSATLTIDGLTVRISAESTPHGPRVTLGGVNCNLEGEMPGEYFLSPIGAPSDPDTIRTPLGS